MGNDALHHALGGFAVPDEVEEGFLALLQKFFRALLGGAEKVRVRGHLFEVGGGAFLLPVSSRTPT